MLGLHVRRNSETGDCPACVSYIGRRDWDWGVGATHRGGNIHSPSIMHCARSE